MSAPERFHGILAPVVTPFRSDLAPDPERLIRHCSWLLVQEVPGAIKPTRAGVPHRAGRGRILDENAKGELGREIVLDTADGNRPAE